LIVIALLLTGCRSLPSLDRRHPSIAFTDTDSTSLGRAIGPLSKHHRGKSGIYSLRQGRQAFAARMLLAQAAERSLDIQYYIWHQDTTGMLLFESIRAAADRGVRVRLLLDDNNTYGLDPLLKTLDGHSNIEVRLFNPFMIRDWRWIGYLTDFHRLNRRMHNKSFTADNQATIIGGRNVGDEYFGVTADTLFVDLDVLAVGPVVTDVSRDFDRYWASASAYPVNLILGNETSLVTIPAAADADQSRTEAQDYLEAVRSSKFVEELRQGQLPMDWTMTHMVSDDPAKGLGRIPAEGTLLQRLREVMGPVAKAMDIVSPYFVPTEDGVDAFARLDAEGVHIRVLTNALEATDVAIVHAGYAKYRKPLLRLGVELYEFRNTLPHDLSQGARGGSSQTSLHAKTMAFDEARVFIGSFNFDPRSAALNTELGFVIESKELARAIRSVFDRRIDEQAYEVRLAESGDLYWVMGKDGRELRFDEEPGSGSWQRLVLRVLAWLPIEWLL
jgi:putative cardiolipin synthase